MKKENLQKYCGEGIISKPFSKGGFSYATDGVLIIRVAQIEGVEEQIINKPNVDSLWSKHVHEGDSYFPIPEIPEPESNVCTWCFGTGNVNPCPECNGEGVVYFSNHYNEYECDCETCDGSGFHIGDKTEDKREPKICKRCKGEGKIYKYGNSTVSGRLYNNKYLLMLKKLPNCVLAEAKDLDPGHFIFDGGDGFIMPLDPSFVSVGGKK